MWGLCLISGSIYDIVGERISRGSVTSVPSLDPPPYKKKKSRKGGKESNRCKIVSETI